MLQINWGTLVLQILNFAVMAFILARFFFKPVVRILDERSKKVTSALDEAQRREKEATEIHAEYQEKLAEAEEQVLVIRQQAQDELTRTKEKFLAETRQEVQEMREKAASQPEIAFSLPAGPISTMSSKIVGGMVKVSPSQGSATWRAHNKLPLAESSASRYPSAVPRTT